MKRHLLVLVLCIGIQCEPLKVLVFTKTNGFRHTSIEAGVAELKKWENTKDVVFVHTEDSTYFREDSLEQFDVVLFLSTHYRTGSIIDSIGKVAFQKFIELGGGWVGVHAACPLANTQANPNLESEWPWFNDFVGAKFTGHPAVQQAKLIVVDSSHESAKQLPANWLHTDEWYDYDQNPRTSGANIILTVDETSYNPGTHSMHGEHPITWSKNYEKGRMWYTGLGHLDAVYSDSLFKEHLWGGITWAAGPTEQDTLEEPMNFDGYLPYTQNKVLINRTHLCYKKCSVFSGKAYSVHGKHILEKQKRNSVYLKTPQ